MNREVDGMKPFNLFRRTKNAFTLVEVLISLFIVAALGGSVVSLLYLFIGHYEQISEHTLANQRGLMVLSILEPAVLSCSLGIPDDLDKFKSAFLSDKKIQGIKTWSSPVFIGKHSSSDPTSSDLKIVYSLSLPAYSSELISIKSDDSTCDVYITDPMKFTLENSYGGGAGDAGKSGWITFPDIKWPFWADLGGWSGGKRLITIKIPSSFYGVDLPKFSNLMAVRTSEFYLDSSKKDDNDALYVRDNFNFSQPMVRGVLKILFDLNSEGVFKVFVMTRGDKNFGEDQEGNFSSWPLSGELLSGDQRNYKIAINSATWRIRN